ncbi:MAG: exodeoxyribonuclease VII large subunit, partial [Christensenellales bacterium]
MMLERLPISVSELNEYVRLQLAGDPMLRGVEVTGELSGYKRHISGHRYFSLKDEGARVQCVMFRQQAFGLDFEPEDGMRVTVRANASLFVRDGSYQLYVDTMRQDGAGALFLRFEALKRKLLAEGLFDPARKREIPYYPRVIGVATSKTGAAIRDIIRVAKRRNPGVGIVVAPCAVQGAAAADEIVSAIRRLNEHGEAEVLLVGRGGGSMEDLWPFNEERVARAIADSAIPVISCVGHEVDVTIADFVADVRAATPSMAAELAVPVRADLLQSQAELTARLVRALSTGQALRRARLDALTASVALADPKNALIKPRLDALMRLSERAQASVRSTSMLRGAKLTELARTLHAVSPRAVL